MKKYLIYALALLSYASAAAWGQKGHDVVAYIAECNLRPAVYQKVVKALGDHSPVYYANWLDNASHTPEYAYTKTWHYANVDAGYTYDTMEKNPKGDVVMAVENAVAALKSGKLSPAEEKLNLQILIHCVGDLHCPMHAGHKSDLGGNQVKVKFFNSSTVLHKVWDSNLIESAHKWSYTEWEQQLDRPCPAERKEQLVKGSYKDWYNESLAIATDIYDATPDGTVISFDYINKYAETAEQQLLKGGLRLAHLLNEIYK